MPRKSKEVYCICKRGRAGDGSGYMICCDGCNQWFHGDCVGVAHLDDNESWFCQVCVKNLKYCGFPECDNAVLRKNSKYCSDECGIKFNKIRYERFFKPRWAKLEEKHSAGRFMRLSLLSKLDEKKEEEIKRIGKLKQENDELIANIATIKTQAKELSKLNTAEREQDEDESDEDREDQEELITGDQTRVFCVICGISQPGEKVFKHFASCHKKQESVFNFTSDVPIKLSCEGVDQEPQLYCQKQDKKTKRYCMNIQSACPQHSNWHIDNDEICACPLNFSEELIPDGNYCLELKKDCRLHYNWDKFRLAAKNMERIQAFNSLDSILDKINRTQMSLNDTYGGVIGVMKHQTIDHEPSTSATVNNDDQNIDVEMLND